MDRPRSAPRCARLGLAAGLALLGFADSAPAGGFTFDVVGDTFTYTDTERSFGGLILFPPGTGPFPAIVFDHGQGGTPATYPNVAVMRDWGAIVVAPTLSHVSGGETSPPTTGHCPENLARGLAMLAVLQTRPDVDPTRIAVFGHSKGAYAAIGQVSAAGTVVRAAAITAGGIVPDSAGTQQSAPTVSESSGVTAPFILFHGNVDGAVPPSRSVAFRDLLQSLAVPVERIEYDVSALDPNVQHNLHLDPAINADLLQRTRAWFTQWGVLGAGDLLLVDGFETAAATPTQRP